ncbi:MAG: FAD-dependent monooxygenase [Pseudomonadota bacterium]
MVDVVIVGGGIGGLATALAVRAQGLSFVLLERAPAIETVGAGIQLSPNAIRVLYHLGLESRLAPVVVRPRSLEIRAFDTGQLILETPLGDVARDHFGAPYFHAHRADLVDAMLDALGPDHVRLGVEVARFDATSNDVGVTLTNGETIRGRVLVGADGIHSAVRDQMHDPRPARYSGTAWRALVPADAIRALGIEEVSGVWWGPERNFVHYYVSGGRQFNWIGIVPDDPSSIESWTTKGDVSQVLEEFSDWHETVREIIGASSTVYKWALFDREPLPHWTEGRVTLLGDAAHSMLPYHAQGAAMCIEDGYVLADALSQFAEATDALSHYEQLRRPRATWVQAFSRAAERHFNLADPEAVARRDARLRASQNQYREGFPPGQETIYGYDALSALATAAK